jgi:dihydrofolate reductase
MDISTKIKVSAFMAISLDGFIARPDGDVAWLHEGEPIGGGDDDGGGYGEFFSSIDVLVMGRGSFEKVLEFDPWPYGEKPVVVLSKSLTEVPEKLRDSVEIETSTPQELIGKCLQEGYKHIYLDGGKIIQSFLREGLVDEMTLTTIPILIGQGRALFGELENDIKLHHAKTRSWNNGFVQSTYQILK